jgi:hypothetical protein
VVCSVVFADFLEFCETFSNEKEKVYKPRTFLFGSRSSVGSTLDSYSLKMHVLFLKRRPKILNTGVSYLFILLYLCM